MFKSVTVMLCPNNWQQTRLFQYAGVARFSYNWALSVEEDSLHNNGKFLSDGELRRKFTQLKKLQEYCWLNDVSNDVAKQAIKDCVKAYQKYFKLRKSYNYKPYSKKQIEHSIRIGKELTEIDRQGHPKYKSKRNYDDFSFFHDAYKLKVSSTHVQISALYKYGNRKRQGIKSSIKLAERNAIPTNCKLFNPRISFDGINWWISVSYEINEQSQSSLDSNGLGIDLGIKDTAILSDGTKFENINKLKSVRMLEKRKRRLQRSISRKYRMNKKENAYVKTNNIKKRECKLLKLNRRLTNIRHNYVHQITSNIVSRKPKFICIEDLNVSGMTKNKHLSKAIQNQLIREIRRQLEYKSARLGVQIVVADRYYPSSKMCSCCGLIKKDLKLSDRVYRCECGYIEDRDINAALNLLQYGTTKI